MKSCFQLPCWGSDFEAAGASTSAEMHSISANISVILYQALGCQGEATLILGLALPRHLSLRCGESQPGEAGPGLVKQKGGEFC